MTTVGITLITSLLFFLIIGVPIAYSLGLSALLAIFATGTLPTMVFAQRIFTASDSFPLMAIIFFMLSGELMMLGGISQRLVNFATSILGKIRGNLAIISVVTSAFFGAISGSALATTAAIGSIMYPEMVKRGYKGDYTATLQATSGTLGILIPPSIPLVIYGVLTGVSIGDLFLAVVPSGILLTLLYIGAAYVPIIRENMAPNEEVVIKVSFIKAFKEAIWGLLMPVIILGGIYSGIFTPTESAIVACVYAVIVGLFVYKELDVKLIIKSLGKSAITAASVMIIIGCATLFGWVLTSQNIPTMVAKWVISLTDSPIVFLLLVNFVYLIAGMFMETSTIILLVVPLLLPVAVQLGVSPLHFGIITVVNLSLGLITPPFGANLFVSSGITMQPISKIYVRTLPFIVAGITGTLITTYVPAISEGFLMLFAR